MKTMRARGAVLVLAAFSLAAPARAEGTDTPPLTAAEQSKSDRADALVKQANTFGKKDQWAEAEPLFQEAFRLKRSYDIAGNLGLAESALGKFRQAAGHLRFALDTFPVNGKPEHRKLLEAMFDKARAEVGALAIRVNVTGATVLVDGEEVGLAPLRGEVFVDPGVRAVEAQLPGRTPAKQDVLSVKGKSADVELRVPDAPVQAAAAANDSSATAGAPRRRMRLVPVIVGGGLALVGLSTGIALTVAANGDSSDAELLRRQVDRNWACRTPTPEVSARCDALHDALSSRDSLSDGAAFAFVAGGVILAGTAAFAVWDWMGVRKSATVGVAPVVGRHAGGVTMVGSW
jgi:hypothetical protein